MKIAVSASAPGLDAEVDPRFGRCPYFVIVDPETKQFEAMENSAIMASGGAGISSAQAIAGKGISAVLTGNCGPNAYRVLSAAGISILTGVSGRVTDVVDAYNSGRYQNISQPTVEAHFGMGGGGGRGSTGRGMGKEMRDIGAVLDKSVTSQQSDTAGELNALKEKLKLLSEQLSSIQRSIEEMENM